MQQTADKESYSRLKEDPAGTVFLPNFCSIRPLFAVVLSTQLLAVILSLASVDALNGFLQELSLISLLVQWIALSTLALLCAFRGVLQRVGNRMAGLYGESARLIESRIEDEH